MCKHNEFAYVHTRRGIFGNTVIYCILCIWAKYTHLETVDVLLTSFPDDIPWDDDPRVDHQARLEAADLSWPIFITDGCELIDGGHRIIKARKQMRDRLRAIVLNEADLLVCIFNGK